MFDTILSNTGGAPLEAKDRTTLAELRTALREAGQAVLDTTGSERERCALRERTSSNPGGD